MALSSLAGPIPPGPRSYSQHLRFALAADASAVVVDWLGAGRVAKGERWAFREYRSRMEFSWEETWENFWMGFFWDFPEILRMF